MAREDIPGTMEDEESSNVEMPPMSEVATPERSDGKPKSSTLALLSSISSSGIGGGGLLGCHGMTDAEEEETAPVDALDISFILSKERVWFGNSESQMKSSN